MVNKFDQLKYRSALQKNMTHRVLYLNSFPLFTANQLLAVASYLPYRHESGINVLI